MNLNTIQKLVATALMGLLMISCEPENREAEINQLLELEKQWLDDEFVADTASISSILEETFLCISPDSVFTKQSILKQIIRNYEFRQSKSIVIDSVSLENPVIHFYGNTAVVTFSDHTYAHILQNPIETETMFYDVWIKRNGSWKAVSSQAHY